MNTVTMQHCHKHENENAGGVFTGNRMCDFSLIGYVTKRFHMCFIRKRVMKVISNLQNSIRVQAITHSLERKVTSWSL